MSQDLVSYSSSLGRAEYHISFIPKYRHKIFSYGRIKAVCELTFHSISKQHNFTIQELGFDIDHLHMIVSLPPHMSIARCIQLLKGISSRKLFQTFPWLREYKPNEPRFWGGNLWSGAYYFDSIGRTTTDVMQQYVKNQGQKGDRLRKLTEFIN